MTDLGSLGGYSYAYAINDAGEVVGSSLTGPGASSEQAFLYSDGRMSELDVPGDPYSINNHGDIVGISPGLGQTGFLYSGGTVRNLIPLTTALKINDQGQIVGSIVSGSSGSGVIYKNGTITPIGSNGGNTEALAINNLGHVVGDTYITPTAGTSGNIQPVFFDGTLHQLPLPSGAQGSALAINDRDQVFGYYFTGDGSSRDEIHAFIYADGVLNDLGNYFPVLFAAINNLGQVAFENAGVGGGAYLFSDGTVTNLNTLIAPTSGWELEGAYGINNLGQIVGWGHTPSGDVHAYLLTPVPELGGIWLVAGLAIAACRGSRVIPNRTGRP